MVKVLSVKYNDTEKTALISLFADKESDIQPTYGEEVVPIGYSISMGSVCKVATGEKYYYTSGNQWVKDESGGGGGDEGRAATPEEIDEAISDITGRLHLD